MGEKESEEVVRRAVDAWNANDWALIEALHSPEVEVIAPREWPEGGTFRGWEAVRRQFERLKDSWSLERYEAENIEAKGDTVLLVGTWIGTGETSGLDLGQEICPVFTVEGGRIARIEYYLDEAEARRAAGLQQEVGRE
jgi:uncharacterized protein